MVNLHQLPLYITPAHIRDMFSGKYAGLGDGNIWTPCRSPYASSVYEVIEFLRFPKEGPFRRWGGLVEVKGYGT